MALMLQQLKDNPNKVPSPSSNEMMRMLNSTWNKLNINNVQAFKNLFVTNSPDGSQDYLVSDKLFSLIGESMRRLRKELVKTKAPETLKLVVRSLIPPKGIHRKNIEGMELFDNEGLLELIPDEESDIDTDADSSDYENQAANNLEIQETPIDTEATQNPVVHDMVSLVRFHLIYQSKKIQLFWMVSVSKWKGVRLRSYSCHS